MSFILDANKNQLTVRQREPVTSGSVNAYLVKFEFSEDWDGMEKTACFRSGAQVISTPLDNSGECEVPWEVIDPDDKGKKLFAGVYGSKDGDVILPTIWACLGEILEGVTFGQNARPPTPNLWEQKLAEKGDALGYTESGELGLYAGDKLLSTVPLQGGEGEGGNWGIGHGLKIVNGSLTVNSTNDFNGDNTLPMTAAGVQATVGNIEALLGTI